jgi:hypothetical protein
MFNQFAVSILERLTGRKLAALLGDISGTTERTWRNRFKHGWEPTKDECRRLIARHDAAFIQSMVKVGGWPADEARAIAAERPSVKAGTVLPTADLIYQFSPGHGINCPETIALATHFDRDCEALSDAVRAGDVQRVREALVAMLDWLLTFCPQATDTPDVDVDALRTQFESGVDAVTLLQAARPLSDALILHLLSCWDLEFCAGYFEGSMQAYPLFQLVMPCFAAGIDIAPETGRFTRNSIPPRKHVLETATSRFIDFVLVLVAWRRDRRLPNTIPRLKEFAVWAKEENEARLVSWRDETTRLTLRHFESIWCRALTPDRQGIYPALPLPMFVCTHLWSPLLIRENGRPSQLIDLSGTYRHWWERNRDRLTHKGLQFGEQAWPDCLTAQRASLEAFTSAPSSQSEGRSSSPRDCQ